MMPNTTDTERWTEVDVGSEGIGVTLYEEDDSDVRVVDEWWATRAELERMNTKVQLDD